ncbi:MAG: protein kinase, partial [Proteobacteria bacterium]|nr:protein kinase [Pseudomonadota bacterium]
GGDLPCPRLYDLVGTPLVTGLVMEWCPVDLERWWREKMREADAFGRLTSTVAEAARRVSDYQTFFASKRDLHAAHGDIKPSNILLAIDGRWLISDFGTASVPIPEDDEWAESRMLVFTENFLSPEVMFNAKKPFPAAMDTWSLGATFFALMKMKRLLDDGGELPRNGTHSPRFRMERMNQLVEVFGHDPTRFLDRDIDAEAFADPLRLPEDDRRAVGDTLVGVFGVEDDDREGQLSEEVLELLDHCMAIDPAHRFTDARALAAAFEKLTRSYIQLAASNANRALTPPPPDTAEIIRSRDDALRRARDHADEIRRLNSVVGDLQQQIDELEDEDSNSIDADEITRALRSMSDMMWHPPMWWSLALLLNTILVAFAWVALIGLLALQLL